MYKFTIYVPGSNLVSHVMSTLSKEFGGTTSTTVLGSYVMASGELVVEPITTIYTFVPLLKRELAVELFADLAEMVRLEEKQESVLVVAEEITSVNFITSKLSVMAR